MGSQAPSGDSPFVSVLIGSRNRPDVLGRCLQSVLRQDYPRIEILILDDGSDSPFEPAVKQKFQDSRITVLRSERSLGVAGGRNLLMSHARGAIFVVLDDDAELESEVAISTVVKAFMQHPQVGIVAFKIVDHQRESTRLLVPFGKWIRTARPDIVDNVEFVSYYHGGGHALRRSVWERTSGYQPDMVYGEEELDLSYRVISEGFHILYLPHVVVHHYPQSSVLPMTNLVQTKLYYHVRNRLFLARKYLPWYYVPSYLVFWMARYFITSLRGHRVAEFARGITDGLSWIRAIPRRPLGSRAVHYLRRHYGRLWY